MPQGPVGRGCEACRAQKKKCDLTQPVCSRCRRLHIPCVGCGQKRFKWSTNPPDRSNAIVRLSRTPSNEVTRLQQALIERLDPSIDPNYHIAFRYGHFLLEIPKHLGSNEVLDASVTALLARHTETSLRQDQSDDRAPAVLHYYRSLATLRAALENACEPADNAVLCASMLLAYCQARFDDQFTFFCSPHGAGIAQMLRIRKFPYGQNSFETNLFGAMYGMLLFQSFANPRVRLSEQEYQSIEDFLVQASGSARDVRALILTVRISQMMAHARQAIASGSSLLPLAIMAKGFEEQMQDTLTDIQERVRGFKARSSETPLHGRLYAQYLRVYGVALGTQASLLCTERTLSPQDATLDSTAADLCSEALRITDDARLYRPVGAVWTVHTLICAWCATQDLALRAKIEDALLDYQRDAMGPNARVQMDALRLLERRLSLLE